MTANVLRLGPLNLSVEILIVAVCVILALLLSRLPLRRHRRLKRHAMDLLTTLLTCFLVGWKVAPAILHPGLLLRDPLPLLMAPGGQAGVLLGGGVALAWGGVRLLRRRRERLLLPSVGVFALALAVGMGGAALVGRLTAAGGVVAPGFTLSTTDGATVSLADLRGQVVVLNFWATWCPPCRAEIPELLRFHVDTGYAGAHLYSVNMTDTESSPAEVASFARERGVVYPILLDTNGDVARRYAVSVVPTTVVLTPGGAVSATRIGAVDAGWLRTAVRAAARQRAPAE